MIVSDGFPQDCDYGPERGNHEYGLRDTAMALEEAERAGIQSFCVTVDRSGHDYLRRMCPEARYMVIAETRGFAGGPAEGIPAIDANLRRHLFLDRSASPASQSSPPMMPNRLSRFMNNR